MEIVEVLIYGNVLRKYSAIVLHIWYDIRYVGMIVVSTFLFRPLLSLLTKSEIMFARRHVFTPRVFLRFIRNWYKNDTEMIL